jgi:hypothetical protein
VHWEVQQGAEEVAATPLGSGRIPVRNGKERTQMAEFVEKSSLDPGESPPSESKEIQMAESIVKSSLDPRKFLLFGSKEVPADNRNNRTHPGCTGKSNVGLRKFLAVGSGRMPARNGNKKSQDNRAGEG